MKKIKKIWSFLVGKDLINVIIWVVVTFIAIDLLGVLFGPDLMPSTSMAYILKALSGISTFAIILLGAWIMLRMFFPMVTEYFVDPDGNAPAHDSEFVYDIKQIRSHPNPQARCYRRPIFFLSIYLLFLAAAIAVTTALL
jgi:uncharacterized membrane protein YuzA (DUF378 family)